MSCGDQIIHPQCGQLLSTLPTLQDLNTNMYLDNDERIGGS
jgi:hypothetical protein